MKKFIFCSVILLAFASCGNGWKEEIWTSGGLPDSRSIIHFEDDWEFSAVYTLEDGVNCFLNQAKFGNSSHLGFFSYQVYEDILYIKGEINYFRVEINGNEVKIEEVSDIQMEALDGLENYPRQEDILDLYSQDELTDYYIEEGLWEVVELGYRGSDGNFRLGVISADSYSERDYHTYFATFDGETFERKCNLNFGDDEVFFLYQFPENSKNVLQSNKRYFCYVEDLDEIYFVGRTKSDSIGMTFSEFWEVHDFYCYSFIENSLELALKNYFPMNIVKVPNSDYLIFNQGFYVGIESNEVQGLCLYKYK